MANFENRIKLKNFIQDAENSCERALCECDKFLALGKS